MNYLTVDFGSTYTKLTAVDATNANILGTASAFTTIETDVVIGFNEAMLRLKNKIGEFHYDQLLCCSSAAGGLKMIALGLVPELTAKAAKMAASSAGAKVIKTYSFEISKYEQEEIFEINPDLVLLCGGTDGGNKDVIIANSRRLCEINRDFSVIIAGNKVATYEVDQVFKESGKDYLITENVMPAFNKLNIEPAKKGIKDLFIKRIIEAKGLSGIQEMTPHEIIPTPLAVMNACELLSAGTKKTAGIGELLAVDIGGATTDIYSMAKGDPASQNITVKGLPEPFNKRTVEGDLGMRYSLLSLYEEIDSYKLSKELKVDELDIRQWVEKCVQNPNLIAEKNSNEASIEEGLAKYAVEIAVERHCGILESAFTPLGELFVLTGKDLTTVPYIIGIGGAIINSVDPKGILKGAEFSSGKITYLKPRLPKYLLDEKYIFASMGLLSQVDPETALKIMLKEIKLIQ